MTEEHHKIEQTDTETKTSKKLNPNTFIIIAILALVIIIASVITVYFYNQNKKLEEAIRNPSVAAQQETASLLDKLGRHLILPTGENPTIATVSDMDKLKDQPFFANAKNGDKVIIYTTAKKAILYDPVADKIIDVTTININNPTASASATPIINQNLKISIYNGTNTSGLTQTAEKVINSKITGGVEILSKENAAKKDYEKTLVIDLKGTLKTEASQIASTIGGVVAAMPSGEKKPDADILIILGADYVKK